MKDCYQVLGVTRTATADEIKQAYRNLIKACHPDLNSSTDAASWTLQLNEAYNVLCDNEAKRAHDRALDASRIAALREKPEAVFDPAFRCAVCSRIDSTLRISSIWRVRSFLFRTRRTRPSKVLCASCRTKESLASSGITVLLGWWSFSGLIWTIRGLIYNANGGEQPADDNADFLKRLAVQFEREQRFQELYRVLRAANRLNPDRATKERLRELKRHARSSLKKPWYDRLLNFEFAPAFYHGAIVVGVLLLVLLIFKVV
jgi:curved DNA-binding protein CbpA